MNDPALVPPLQVTVPSLNSVLEYFIQVTDYRLSPFMSSLYNTNIGEPNAAITETFQPLHPVLEKSITANANVFVQQKLNQVSPESSPYSLKVKPGHSGGTRRSLTFLVVCLLKATLETSMRTSTHLKWDSPEAPWIGVLLNCRWSCRRLWNGSRGITLNSQKRNTASGTTKLLTVTVGGKLGQQNGNPNAEFKLDLSDKKVTTQKR